MAYENSTPAVPQDGQLDPNLQEAAGQFQTDEGKEWSADVLKDVQQHVNLKNVADANEAAGQHLENTYNDVKTNLLGMVQDDPTSAQLAVGIAPKLLEPLFAHMDSEAGGAAHGEAASALQTEIAHASIMRMADFSSDGAHMLMGQLKDHVGGDESEGILGNYIATMQTARTADDATNAQQLAGQQLRSSGIAAFKYGRGLLDPQTEQVQFPQTYLADLVRNNQILPDDKEALFLAHGNLSQLGDKQTDPFVMNQMVNRLNSGDDLTHKEIMQHVGGDLKYADALMLHGLANTRTPEFDGHISDLAATLNDARNKLVNGTRAGDAAFARFTDWFLPSYRRAGTDGFDPKSENYLFGNTSLANFAPKPSDNLETRNGPRQPLSEIFATPQSNTGPNDVPKQPRQET